MKLVVTQHGTKIDGGGNSSFFGGLVNIWVGDCITQYEIKNECRLSEGWAR